MSNTHQLVVHSDGKKTSAFYYTRVCQKAITIIVKGAISNDILNMVENELDKLTMEAERMLHQMNKNNIDI